MNIKSGIWPSLTFSFSILLLAPGSHAAEVDFEFVRGPLSQSNFEQAEVAINDNHARISALESQVSALIAMNQTLQNENAALQSQVNDLTSGIVAGLGDYVSVGVDDYGNPAVFYDAVNVYIRSGLNSSTQANGLGNLLIGYNKPIHEQNDQREIGIMYKNLRNKPISKRQFLIGASALGASTLASAQDPGRYLAGAAPIRYPEPDVLPLDPRFTYKIGNAAIERIYTGMEVTPPIPRIYLALSALFIKLTRFWAPSYSKPKIRILKLM